MSRLGVMDTAHVEQVMLLCLTSFFIRCTDQVDVSNYGGLLRCSLLSNKADVVL